MRQCKVCKRIFTDDIKICPHCDGRMIPYNERFNAPEKKKQSCSSVHNAEKPISETVAGTEEKDSTGILQEKSRVDESGHESIDSHNYNATDKQDAQEEVRVTSTTVNVPQESPQERKERIRKLCIWIFCICLFLYVSCSSSESPQNIFVDITLQVHDADYFRKVIKEDQTNVTVVPITEESNRLLGSRLNPKGEVLAEKKRLIVPILQEVKKIYFNKTKNRYGYNTSKDYFVKLDCIIADVVYFKKNVKLYRYGRYTGTANMFVKLYVKDRNRTSNASFYERREDVILAYFDENNKLKRVIDMNDSLSFSGSDIVERYRNHHDEKLLDREFLCSEIVQNSIIGSSFHLVKGKKKAKIMFDQNADSTTLKFSSASGSVLAKVVNDGIVVKDGGNFYVYVLSSIQSGVPFVKPYWIHRLDGGKDIRLAYQFETEHERNAYLEKQLGMELY